jgi:hypothetical protein
LEALEAGTSKRSKTSEASEMEPTTVRKNLNTTGLKKDPEARAALLSERNELEENQFRRICLLNRCCSWDLGIGCFRKECLPRLFFRRAQRVGNIER